MHPGVFGVVLIIGVVGPPMVNRDPHLAEIAPATVAVTLIVNMIIAIVKTDEEVLVTILQSNEIRTIGGERSLASFIGPAEDAIVIIAHIVTVGNW